MLELLMLIIGFIIIIKSADLLVDCTTSLAIKSHLPKMLIALTMVSFGTCAPEVAISFQSISSQNGEIAFANVVGSCIINVFLIIGLACIVRPIKVQHKTVKKELPILVLITTCFSVLMLDSLFNPATPNEFSRADGVVLLLVFFIFVLYLFQLLRNKDEALKKDNEISLKYKNPIIAFVLLFVSLILIIFSSDMIVNNAAELAYKLNISEKLVTMVIIAIGTSLPEMITTYSSAKKGEFDIAIGNIIGTNIFNICIVLGLPIVLYGGIGLQSFSIIDIIVIFSSSIILYIFAKNDNVISKKEGWTMLAIFITYYAYILLQ